MDSQIKALLEEQLRALQDRLAHVPEEERLAKATYNMQKASLKAKRSKLNKEIKKLGKVLGA